MTEESEGAICSVPVRRLGGLLDPYGQIPPKRLYYSIECSLDIVKPTDTCMHASVSRSLSDIAIALMEHRAEPAHLAGAAAQAASRAAEAATNMLHGAPNGGSAVAAVEHLCLPTQNDEMWTLTDF